MDPTSKLSRRPDQEAEPLNERDLADGDRTLGSENPLLCRQLPAAELRRHILHAAHLALSCLMGLRRPPGRTPGSLLRASTRHLAARGL